MPRKPENMEEKIRLIIEAGLDKEYFEELYRGNNFFNQRKIASMVSSKLPWVSQKHIKAIFKHYNIEMWNRQDTAKAYAKAKETAEYAEKHMMNVSNAGYSLDDLKKFYQSEMSKNDIIEKINTEAGKVILTKDSIKGIWDYYELPVRSTEEDNALRMKKVNEAQRERLESSQAYGDGYSAEELVHFYISSDFTLEEVAEKTGSNSTTISKLVRQAGYEIENRRKHG